MIRKVLLLAVAMLAALAGTADAHTASATAACGSVVLQWQSFSATGSGNHGLNTPDWTVSFTPAGASSPTFTETDAPPVSFSGSSFVLTVNNLPRVDGTVIAVSSWRANQTRDGNASSHSQTLLVGGCLLLTPTLTTTATPAAATVGSAITDVAHLGGGYVPTGTIGWALYGPGDAGCASSTPLTTSAVSVHGAGDYTSPALVPSQAGTYHWVATYSGDADNDGVGPVGCADASETVTLSTPPPSPPSPPATPPATSPPASVPASGVLACGPSPTSIRVTNASGKRGFEAVVTGAHITRVVYYLDGKRVKTVTKPDAGAQYRIRIVPASMRYGTHALTARITQQCGARVLALRFVRARPARRIVPRFTG